ncbi:hypothetical protein [Streptomyces sp. NPDC052302]|uniref:hypothetical protein n=1 Tax=Streptomyces sp. NPDC052302 TaxID=3365688 RepID=UPI0037D0958B
MPTPTDPQIRFVVALLCAAVAVLVGVTYPAAIPALTLGVAVLVVAIALLKL